MTNVLNYLLINYRQDLSWGLNSCPQDTEKVPTTSLDCQKSILLLYHISGTPVHSCRCSHILSTLLTDGLRSCVRILRSTTQPGIVILPLRLIMSDKEKLITNEKQYRKEHREKIRWPGVITGDFQHHPGSNIQA